MPSDLKNFSHLKKLAKDIYSNFAKKKTFK